MRRPFRVANAAGFTLVEIMITLTLGLILMTAAIGYYIANIQARAVNDASSGLQDAARIAFDVMARDIRSAGDFGCVNATMLSGGISSYFDITHPLIGYGNGSSAATANAAISPPLGSATVNTALGLGTYLSDVLVVSGNSGALSRVKTPLAAPVPQDAVFSVNDYVAIGDCISTGTLFKVTAVDSSTGALTPSLVLTSPAPAVGQELARIDTVWYAVTQPPNLPLGLYRYSATKGGVTLVSPLFFGHAAAGNTPATLAVSPLAPGLVLQYGFDVDGDGVVDCTLAATNLGSPCLGSTTGAAVTPTWNLVRSVVINALLMSAADHVVKAPMDFTFNGVYYPARSRPQDFHLYLPFSETVLLRNPPSS